MIELSAKRADCGVIPRKQPPKRALAPRNRAPEAVHAVLVLAERLQRQAGVVDGGEVQVRDTAAVVAQHHAVVPLEAGAAGGVRGQRDGLHPGGAARLDGDPAVVEIADLIVLGAQLEAGPGAPIPVAAGPGEAQGRAVVGGAVFRGQRAQAQARRTGDAQPVWVLAAQFHPFKQAVEPLRDRRQR